MTPSLLEILRFAQNDNGGEIKIQISYSVAPDTSAIPANSEILLRQAIHLRTVHLRYHSDVSEILIVAYEIGLYHPRSGGVRRIVSGDTYFLSKYDIVNVVFAFPTLS